MRVQLITQLFDPENAIKGLSFVQDLARRGYEVEVVTTYPSYPGGQIYPGYRMRLMQLETIEGVRVVRLPSYVAHGRSALKRLLSYASFSASAFFYSLFVGRKPDVIYSYFPPMVGGVACAILGGIHRRPFIYDVQDLWPEALVATGMLRNPRGVSLIERCVGWVYKRASAIVVLSEGYKRTLVAKGVPESKIHRIYNWCDESRLKRSDPSHGSTSSFDIIYAGNLGAAQALGSVIQAAQLLQQDGERGIRFVFIGDGIEGQRLKEQAASLGLENVEFRGSVPPEAIGAELSKADALLVHLADDPVFEITVPSKTQAYMAMGKPILMAVAGESAEIIQKAGAGMIARPCTPASIAETALQMARSTPEQLAVFGAAAEGYYRENMSQKNGVEHVSRILTLVTEKFGHA
ncbi:glycosyltransferase family 4 protein [Pseudomonas sp. BN414]|uniref:glycosyltransferase family 4 protein n=1 Tax=Pseudomonas sp. BN414 TaxID=2567888 RepID=UPI002455208D|nr:glycosyltransferase family 4 protein [Pseudomonas sp. BN414]MDH4568824.1 glycosyltransferase family 4 protein [Pseudomonas sp. BN414]